MIITVTIKHTSFVIDNRTIGVIRKQIKSYIIFNVISKVVIGNKAPIKTFTIRRNYGNSPVLLAVLL